MRTLEQQLMCLREDVLIRDRRRAVAFHQERPYFAEDGSEEGYANRISGSGNFKIPPFANEGPQIPTARPPAMTALAVPASRHRMKFR
jgi:hypothetical protein